MKTLYKIITLFVLLFTYLETEAQLVLNSIDVVDVSDCYGGSNGSITVNASGGYGALSYSVDGGIIYQASNFFPGLSAGVYSVFVKDEHLVVVSDAVYVDEPNQIFIEDEVKTNVTGCYGNSNGSINITASGGTGTLNYSIDGLDYSDATGVFSGLSAGTYNVSVRDQNLCVKNGSAIIITQPTQLTIVSESVTNVIGCNGDNNGTIDILASGGTSPIQYSINGGANFYANHFFSPLTPANYQLVIKDVNGCTTVGSNLAVTEPDEVIITAEAHTNVSLCYGDHDGTITITASGGTGTLFYMIDGTNYVANAGNFNNLFAGTYEVKVKDQNNCIANGSVIVINQPNAIIIDSESETDITTCYGDETGSITINAHGGIAPLEYSINSGTTYQFANSFINLASGTYLTMVKDANGCEVIGQNHILEQPSLLIITEVNTTDVSSCYGGNNGTIHVVTNGGGTPAYEFSVNGGTNYYPTNNITGLFAGVYNVIVRDSQNCTDTFNTHVVEIFEPAELIITSEIPTDPLCFGGTDGQINVTATGGTGQIFYSTDGVHFYTGNILSGLSAGINYNIVVKDSHGCMKTGGSYILGQPSELIIDTIIVQDVDDCFGGTNGSIVINAHGGTNPLNYTIDSEITYQPGNTFLGLGAGSYQILVKDQNNCKTDGGVVSIYQPEPIQVSYQSFQNVKACKGDNNGEIHIDAVGGSPDPVNGYQYSITGGAPYFYNNGDFLNLFAGTYQIRVMDENGCAVSGNDISISEPDELIPLLVSQQNIRCYGNSTGYINLSASGGQFPYKYSIDGGLTYISSSFFSNLPAGIYQTSVRDAYNCEQLGAVVTLTQPDSLEIISVSYTDVIGCYGSNNGTITINAAGGVPSYLYSINLGSTWYNNGGNFTNLATGDYLIKVQDANFCTAVFLDASLNYDTIHITQPTKLDVDSILKTDILCNGDNNGTISIFASGGTGTLSYSIDNGVSFPNATGLYTNLAAANYQIKVRDVNNCTTISYAKAIYEPSALVISNVVAEDESCLGANDGIITIYAVGGTWPYEYSADGVVFQSERVIQNLAPGTYTPEIRDKNLCSLIGPTVEINSPNDPSLFTTSVSEGCSPLEVEFTRVNPGTTYYWDYGDGTGSGINNPHTFTNLSSSTITYTVTAYSVSPSNCLDTAEMMITVFPQPQPDFSVTPMTLFYPDNELTITNNTPIYSNYLWNFGDGSSDTNEFPGTHSYDACGEYVLTMTAENTFSCRDSISKNILLTARQPEALYIADTLQHCTPYTFTIENNSEYYETFNWELENGTLLSDNQITLTYDNPATYTVKLNVYGYCNTSDSETINFTVFQSPVVDFEVFPDTVMCPNQPIRCMNKSSDDSELFFWKFGDGGTSLDENPVYFYQNPGNYPVTLTVVSENKCIDSLTYFKEVVVIPEGDIQFPNAFTPNGNGENDVFKAAIFHSVKSFKMEIFNRWGELMFYTEDINAGWDGYYKNQLSIQDVYVWRAQGIYNTGTPFECSGSVTLIR